MWCACAELRWGRGEQSLLCSHYASHHTALLSKIRKGSVAWQRGEEYCVTILKMAALLETWINVLLEVFEVLIQSSGLKSFPTN